MRSASGRLRWGKMVGCSAVHTERLSLPPSHSAGAIIAPPLSATLFSLQLRGQVKIYRLYVSPCKRLERQWPWSLLWCSARHLCTFQRDKLLLVKTVKIQWFNEECFDVCNSSKIMLWESFILKRTDRYPQFCYEENWTWQSYGLRLDIPAWPKHEL
jgi:hypothetical protein